MSVVTPDISLVIGATATLEIEMKIVLVIDLGPEKEAARAIVATGAKTKRKNHILNQKQTG